MIDFDEELKKYKPQPLISDVEESVRNRELKDLLDFIKDETDDETGGK